MEIILFRQFFFLIRFKGGKIFFPTRTKRNMPAPQPAEKRCRPSVISRPEFAVAAVIFSHNQSPLAGISTLLSWIFSFTNFILTQLIRISLLNYFSFVSFLSSPIVSTASVHAVICTKKINSTIFFEKEVEYRQQFIGPSLSICGLPASFCIKGS